MEKEQENRDLVKRVKKQLTFNDAKAANFESPRPKYKKPKYSDKYSKFFNSSEEKKLFFFIKLTKKLFYRSVAWEIHRRSPTRSLWNSLFAVCCWSGLLTLMKSENTTWRELSLMASTLSCEPSTVICWLCPSALFTRRLVFIFLHLLLISYVVKYIFFIF